MPLQCRPTRGITIGLTLIGVGVIHITTPGDFIGVWDIMTHSSRGIGAGDTHTILHTTITDHHTDQTTRIFQMAESATLDTTTYQVVVMAATQELQLP